MAALWKVKRAPTCHEIWDSDSASVLRLFQVQVGPYFRGLPAVPPTLWPNSYGLTPYLVIWHGAHTGFRSNGLTCWVRGLVFVPFLWLASLIWGGSMQPDCPATLHPPTPHRHNREPGGNLFPSAHGQQPGVHYRARDRLEAASRAWGDQGVRSQEPVWVGTALIIFIRW